VDGAVNAPAIALCTALVAALLAASAGAAPMTTGDTPGTTGAEPPPPPRPPVSHWTQGPPQGAGPLIVPADLPRRRGAKAGPGRSELRVDVSPVVGSSVGEEARRGAAWTRRPTAVWRPDPRYSDGRSWHDTLGGSRYPRAVPSERFSLLPYDHDAFLYHGPALFLPVRPPADRARRIAETNLDRGEVEAARSFRRLRYGGDARAVVLVDRPRFGPRRNIAVCTAGDRFDRRVVCHPGAWR
jgi:hypothetical protein